MPLYEYHCPSCESDFEALVRGSELPACPECGRTDRLEKLLSVPAALVAGGGGLPMAGPGPGGCSKPGCGPGGCGMGMGF